MFPELPTIHESGVPNYEAANWWAIAAPTGVSTSIIMKINNEISQYLKNPEVLKRFNNEGVEIDIKTPDQISRMIKADLQKWASVAKSAGMKAD
jgi:tripartite-type tricarboxylate transporter receptor subunit TctC